MILVSVRLNLFLVLILIWVWNVPKKAVSDTGMRDKKRNKILSMSMNKIEEADLLSTTK